jgi:cytochrome c oxidase cbb3-type subunit III
MAQKPDFDRPTGVHTTGHEWDGIQELNNPMPRWWLTVWYVTIAWSVVYWILLPAWPIGRDFTKGLLGYSERAQVGKELADKVRLQGGVLDRMKAASLEEIEADPELKQFALAGGRSAFGNNCIACHGTGGQGGFGFPNLNDDDWLWTDGRLEDIYTTLQYGIRSGHPQARTNDMPAFGTAGLLTNAQIDDVVSFVRSLSMPGEESASVERGGTIFAENCAACHGEDGRGNRELGAPNLADRVWLYGGDRKSLTDTIHHSRGGVMPAWNDRLNDVTIKQLTVFVHNLGGGK